MVIEKQELTIKRIEDIKKFLHENKEGVWISKIRKSCEIPIGSITYLIFGQTKEGKRYGGYILKEFEDRLEIIEEGRNKKIRLK